MIADCDRYGLAFGNNVMKTQVAPTHDSPPREAGGAPFEQSPIVAHVETDRYCRHCAYNLRTQAVRRDSRTELLLVRCPECGRFESARDSVTAVRSWLQRLATVALVLWMVMSAGAFIGINVGQAAANYGTLKELTSYKVTPIKTVIPTGYRMQSRVEIVVRDDYRPYRLFMASISGASFGLAFIAAALLVVAFHHWPRWVYPIVAAGCTAITTSIVYGIWRDEAPHLLGWGTPYIFYHGGLQIIGGLAGVWLGRPLGRLATAILLSPRLRPAMSFLWLADGKTPPSTAERSAGAG